MSDSEETLEGTITAKKDQWVFLLTDAIATLNAATIAVRELEGLLGQVQDGDLLYGAIVEILNEEVVVEHSSTGLPGAVVKHMNSLEALAHRLGKEQGK